jgi:ribosome recycling factor
MINTIKYNLKKETEKDKHFLVKKLTDISEQNTTSVRNINAPADCVGSRNTSC